MEAFSEVSGAGERYAELRTKSCYSFLRGASTPEELVRAAAGKGLAALGIADRETLAGVVQAHGAARDLDGGAAGFRLLVGAEVLPADGPPIVLYPVDRAAYGRLARLLTVGRRRAPKGKCMLELRDVSEHAEGLLAIVVPPRGPAAREAVERARAPFGDRAYLALERHLGARDEERLAETAEIGAKLGLPLVAVNDVHYHDAARSRLQDVLACIREGTAIDEAGAILFPNAERRLKGPAEMAALFRDWPGALERTLEVAARARFSLEELRYEYPDEVAPREIDSQALTPIRWLERLAREGAAGRYPDGVPEKVRAQIEHELRLIEELRYEPFFLTVHDIVRFARSRGILCQGRGSAANSAVCFCLGITSVDPARSDLLFERFVSRERNEPPDIDVDFEHERREEVIQYVYGKYGRERAGIVAEVIRYRGRSAARDVGKALGLSLDQAERLAEQLDGWGPPENLETAARAAGLDAGDARVRHILALILEIQDFPRHLSQHVGGFVITRGPLCELVPIENAAMEDRTVIEWDKDDIDALGILKVDCLALGMLTAIRKTFALVEAAHGPRLSLATVPSDDGATYEMCRHADTVGAFQIESRAQMSMLPRLRPRTFYDLVVQVAIVRPGPIQGGMVHPYLRRRSGEEPITYPSEALRAVLEKTLGVPLFQEQAMRLSIVAAGFTPGEADQLRRAMGAWRRPGAIEGMRRKLVDGMRANGYEGALAEALFEQLKGFGEYGFPESHAASFALLAYVSAWLKRRYPAAFAAALLNSQPMGFYAPAQLVRDAIAHGVEVRPVDVAASGWDCALEGPAGAPPAADGLPPSLWGRGGPALRLGMRLVRGLSEARAGPIVAARRSGEPFRSISQLARLTGLTAEPLARLAAANAFRSLGLDARQALWEVEAVRGPADDLPLFRDVDVPEPAPALRPRAALERVVEDYASVGLSLERHPVAFIRDELRRSGALEAARLAGLRSGAALSVGGLVTVRQRPATAKGIIFMTIEDETGIANAVVRPSVYERFRDACFRSTFVLVEGKLEREGEVVHVLARRLRALSLRGAPTLPSASRDFR